MKKLIYLIVVIVALGLIVAGCLPTVPPTEQGDLSTLTKSESAVVYVATTGSDTTGDGSEGNPWATISHALWISKYVPRVSAGDTIIVAPGTYLEWTGDVSAGCAVKVPWFAEGAGGLTIQSSEGVASTIIDCGWAGWGVQINSNDITFTGFTMKNAYSVINQVSGKGHNLSNLIITDFVNFGLGIYAAHYCTFSNITIHGNEVSESHNRWVKGIDMQEYGSGGNSNNSFEDITIYGIKTTGSCGFSIGIYWEGDNPDQHPSNDNSFNNLTIYNINNDTYFGRGLWLNAKESNAIKNATFSGGSICNCSSTGIYVEGGIENLSITGFNICGNKDYGVKTYNAENEVDATYNWWGNPHGPCTPRDEMNPAGKCKGKGDKVSDNVDFDPWLHKPIK